MLRGHPLASARLDRASLDPSAACEGGVYQERLDPFSNSLAGRDEGNAVEMNVEYHDSLKGRDRWRTETTRAARSQLRAARLISTRVESLDSQCPCPP